jgi:hypothetical protein
VADKDSLVYQGEQGLGSVAVHEVDIFSEVSDIGQGVQQPTNHNLRPWIDWLLM